MKKLIIISFLFSLHVYAIDKDFLKQFLPDNPVIVEAGGYDGGDTQEMAQLWPKASIYTFEPVPHLFTLLQENTKAYSNIHCIPLALNKQSGKAPFYVSTVPGALSGSSSLLEPKEHLNYYPGVYFENRIEVPTINLDEWATQNNIDHIDFMWLDMQGAELDMLKAAPHIVKKTNMVYLEVTYAELYKGGYLFDEVLSWFQEQGFELICIENSSCQAEGNALFVRKVPAKIEKKIVVIITSFNNKDWYKKNLDSVFMQDYTNYTIIYIDDCSPDGTGKLVEAYIKEKGQEWRTTLILQPEWKSQMFNHYHAVYMCDDDAIICHLDGDDEFYDPNTLNIVNEYYLNNDIWLTVGQPLLSTGERLPTIPTNMYEIIEKNSYRKDGWYFNHLRTFYAWLFKLIKLEDLLYQGNFANMAPAPDVAMMYPMYEMAGRHGYVIHELLYIVNVKNPIRQCYLTPEEKILKLADTIRLEWPEYMPLYAPIKNRIKQFQNRKADLIIFAEPLNAALAQTIKANIKNLNNLNKIFIVYEDKGRKITKDLQFLKSELPECTFIAHEPNITFLSALLQHILEITDDYLIFASSDCKLHHKRDISYCITELERTFAYGFYLHLNSGNDLGTMCAPLCDTLIAWQPGYTQNVWEFPNTLGMILYRKKDIATIIKNMHYFTISEFIEQWAHQEMEERAVGLFYKN